MTKILAVDGKRDNLITLSAILKNNIPGVTIITAQSGAQGIEKAVNEQPDTILMDVKMPQMDGYEACTKIKANKFTGHIPVIMLTAIKSESADISHGLNSGADAFLSKPIDEAVLVAQVNTALRIKKAEDKLRNQNVILEKMVSKRTRALEESEKNYRALLETTSEGFWQLNLEFNIVKVNPALCKMLGYSREEMIGKTPFDFADEENQKIFIEKASAIETSQHRSYEIVLKKKSGKDLPAYFNATSMRDASGKVQGAFAFIMDLTDRLQTENALRISEEQLRQAQKMESIGRLAGGVAHDYNNALSVIIGFTELAMDDTDPSGALNDSLCEILNAAKRATDITRQLLAFARKQAISPKVLDLNENVAGMLKMLRRLIGEDIDLTWSPGASLWSVKMDPSQIDQILVNLCVNARDAIENVGRITIGTSRTKFSAADCVNQIDTVPGEFVMLAVSDNGCGMEKEILDNIFEPFFTTKEVDKGTGLGLATVYGIVKQNNGFINVYSEPGKGTTFKIYLPRHEGEALELRGEIATEIPRGRGEVILVVEDDLSILKLAGQILSNVGYTVLTAGTPVEGISMAEKQTEVISLLITDVVMPGMNGRDLAERLQSSYPNLKCIFMSGYTANVIAHHGVLDEGVQFIQKPFSKRDLAIAVRKSLDGEV
jgi:two-component system cell cycle sensor histidine kinase/response regulator CckA